MNFEKVLALVKKFSCGLIRLFLSKKYLFASQDIFVLKIFLDMNFNKFKIVN